MTTNQAALLVEKLAKPLLVKPVPYVRPGPNEIVVKNAAWGLNHIDWRIQSLALFPVEYPAILGEDVAGTVVEVGFEVSRFKKGDRVLGLSPWFQTKQSVHGAFQEYTVIPDNIASPIPDKMSFEDAAGLPLAVSTASVGLFDKEFLALQRPSKDIGSNDKTLLIWGGASAVGASAIQLAVAAGYRVITTASPKNFNLVTQLGASQVFDYHSVTVVEEIVRALNGQDLVGTYDAINRGGAIEVVADVVAKAGGDKTLATVSHIPGGLPESVNVKWITATKIMETNLGKAIFEDYLPSALSDNRFIIALETVVAGKGIEEIQLGLEALAKGVSATKIVVSV
jgi:NADPH:quinone reductase-like Zn-dependent oxidoreductase